MGKKMVVLTYCLAVGFILAVAFHSPSKVLIAAGADIATPNASPK